MLSSLAREVPRPFVKWVGGKSGVSQHILKKISPHLLAEDGGSDIAYYEPFVGGGAIFFNLYKRGFCGHAFLSDRNEHLIDAFTVIKNWPGDLLEILQLHAEKHCEEYYYEVRSNNKPKSPLETAARFIYLNKTCYNGLHRENKKGEFNVPMGSYKNPKIVDKENIISVSEALASVDIRNQDFEAINPKPGDFVYLDPPYYPVSSTSFVGYSRFNFTEDDHVRLKDFLRRIEKENGANWLLTNSDTPFVRKLYRNNGWKLKSIKTARMINSNAKERKTGSAKELIITNY